MTAPDSDNLTQFHVACGQTVRAWAGLEAAFVAYLRVFLDTDAFRARIVWQSLPTPSARFGLLRTLAGAYLDAMRQSQLSQLIERAEALAETRTLLIEAAGGLDLRTGKVMLTSTLLPTGEANPAAPGLHELGIAEIEACADAITTLETEVMMWIRILETALRGSPRRRG